MAVWIDDENGLTAWLEGMSVRGRLAVDCEANGFHAYRPRLCLLQLAREAGPRREARGDDVALVDVLALGGRLGALAAVLSDPAVEKILHGAANDVRMLDRDAGIRMEGLVDTEIAARLLGLPRSGLASLASEIAGKSLSKSGQRFDWARRPLPAKALQYAAEDVKPLFTIRDALVSRLEGLGRSKWLAEECRALETLRWEEPEFPTGGQLLARVKGSQELSAPQREVLKALLTWREAEAARRDVPAIRVAEPGTLRRIARSGCRSQAELESLGLPESLVGQIGRAHV
jgi:ribonuclease D